MTTASTRASQIRFIAMALVAFPFLFGQGCPTTETPLTVIAGADKTVQTTLAVVLQASVSGGSGIYSYSWTPTTGLDNPSALQPTFTASTAGTTTYTLTVTDSQGATASDSAVITVVSQSGGNNNNNNNNNGTASTLAANAGVDKTTSVGAAVTLEGSASGGTSPYTYAWTPTTGLSSASAAQPAYTPSGSGTVTLTLTVTDSLGASDTDTVVVTINPSAALSALTWGANHADGGYEVLATFTRDLGKTSAENVTNYRINGTNDRPTSATLGADKRTVTLIFNQKLSSIARLDIGVGGTLRDAFGGAVASSTNQAIGANTSDTTSPTTTARTWGNGQDQYTVVIQFSEAMDRGSCESISNYTLGGVPPSSASLDATGMVVTLTFANTTAGFSRTDLLEISSGVRDINGQATTSTNPAAMTANAADTTGPSADVDSRVWSVNKTSYVVNVTFNEVMDKTSAEMLANYMLANNLPTAAALDSTGRTVSLTFGQTAIGIAKTDMLSITANVRDINGRDNVSTAETPITASPIDTAGPGLSNEQGRVWQKNGTSYTVLLTFSEVMDRESATTVANYTLAGDAGLDTRNPATAALDATGRIVTLTFPTTVAGLSRADLLTVLADVQDINGQANTSTLAGGINSGPTDTTPPTATSRTWKADSAVYQVDIAYSEVMDKLTTTNITNYRIHGDDGTDIELPTSVVLDPTGRIATLTFATSLGGFNRLDSVEILPGVVDVNGRSTSSITTVGALIGGNAADVTSPGPVRATQTSVGVVDVVFSEVLDRATALAGSYVFAGGLTVDSVSLLPDGVTVRLAVSGGDPVADILTTPATIRDVNNNLSAQTDKTVAQAMTVDAGSDIYTTVDQQLTFTPQVTGGIGPYTYAWTPTTNLVGASTSQPSFTPTSVGTYNFTVVVTDSEGRSATDTLSVFVNPT